MDDSLSDFAEEIRSGGNAAQDRLKKDLKPFLARNRHDILRSWGRTKHTRDSYHALIEALFSYARLEKASYVKATKPTQKTRSTTRLSLCASGLRHTVQVAGHKFKAKMVTAVINHITETLPTTGEGYCGPLCDDYLKTLTILFESPHHVEHLSRDDWQDLAEFCLQGISVGENESQKSHQNGHRDSPSLTETNSSRSTPSRNIKGIAIRSPKSMAKVSIDDLMLCLEQLTGAPNCPILALAEQLFEDIVEALERSSPTSKSSRSAFAILNATLLRTLTEKPTLLQNLALNIVPIIRKFWERSSKSPLLRDEMLTTLTLIRSTFVQLTQFENYTAFEGTLQTLLETLQSEYSRLFERDQLQLDEITFSAMNVKNPLNVSPIHMGLASPRAEHNWMLLQTISNVNVVLESRSSPQIVHSDDETMGPPKKRIRLFQRTEELLRSACSEESGRMSSLHILCFLFASQPLSLESLASILDGLNGVLLEESALAVSWAMLAIASCCGQDAARHESLKPRWLQLWQLTSRSAASVGTSRCACHLMRIILHQNILQYTDCVETFDTIVSPAGLLSAPILSDSALLLWANIMIIRASVNPSASVSTLTRIVTWLRVTWTPEALQDRSLASQMAAHARPMDLLHLLLIATGRSIKFPALLDGPASGPISRASLRLLRYHDLVDYLLLTEPANTKTKETKIYERIAGAEVLQVKEEFDQLVLDLFQNKIDGFAEAWSSMVKSDSSRSNVDAAKIVSSLCITVNAFISCIESKEAKRVKSVRTKCDNLWEQLCKSLSQDPEKLAECLDIFGSCLPSEMDRGVDSAFVLDGIARMVPNIVNLLNQRKEMDLATSFTEDLDFMEVDDSFTSRASQSTQDKPIAPFLRYELPVPADLKSYRNLVTAKLHVLRSTSSQVESDESIIISPTEYLLSLDVSDLISCGSVILEALLFQSSMDRASVNQVINHIGTEVLGGYEFERCEAALCASITVMEGLADFWVNDSGDDLCDSASQVYSWLINVASEKSIMSSRVHIDLAKLLRKVLKINPEYSLEDSMPSPRTSLFSLLSEGDLLVKFEIGRNFSDIFGQFVLKEHEAIFEDVLESLPADSEWIEGLCLRLFVLTELASNWHTLLRRCVYHIFETAGQVGAASKHAMYCLSAVSKSLGLANTQELFKLFVSQLLYTWLETHTLRSIPYGIFGYPSLKALLGDVQDDVTGQIMMRANDEEAQELSECLEVPFETLLATSFPKVEAYSVAHDISTPRSQNSQPVGGEARVRRRLGNTFPELVRLHFPSILAVFFQTMDEDEKIEKAFAKRPEYLPAHTAFSSITNISFSEAVLPANQQPSFRAKYILDELEFLCKRAGYESQTLWTPSLFVFVARRLLDSIHPALGSLHACSVVRKLRVLVALAGETALLDYPLEMMLHALRSLVTDFHSSDDALGLFQYLLDRGRSYLTSNPSFMASIALSTLTSLKVFLNTSQESTTQESEYRATLSRAQRFHAWLCNFLTEYESSSMSEEMEGAFREMIQSAQMARTTGNAIKGTHESSLLLQLLQDRKASQSLLSPPAWNSVFDLLSADFQIPPQFHEDVLSEPEIATAYAGAVWKSVQRPHLGKGYLSWAGRVLGRAYASTGGIQGLKRQEQSIIPNNDRRISNNGSLDSKSEIMLSLSEVLFGDPGPQLGVVESTLQSIAARLGDEQLLHDYDAVIPVSLTRALIWTPYECPDTELKASEDGAPLDSLKWDPHLSVSEWVQSLAVGISLSSAKDPILGTLHRILVRSADFALRLFPFMLHTALLLEYDGQRRNRDAFSALIQECLQERSEASIPHITAMLNAILYLRNQPLPNESTMADRERWLDFNYGDAAASAFLCHMPKTAILFIEIQASQTSRSSRRSSVAKFQEPTELLFNIFRSIDDPDSFYGVDKQASLHSVIEELEYEGTGLKSTSFQSARFDSGIRRGTTNPSRALGLVHSLNSANLKGLARALLADADSTNNVSDDFENTFQTALALQQWDLPTPKSINSDSAHLFRAFQALNVMEIESGIRDTINDCVSSVTKNLITGFNSNTSLSSALGTLASLTEVDELLSSNTFHELENEWSQLVPRSLWMHTANFSDVSRILSTREILFASLSRQPRLKAMVKTTAAEAHLQEIRVLQHSLKLSRKHSALQTSLNTATYLSDLVDRCTELGIQIDAIVQYEVAKVLWDQGEMGTSIKMLQLLESRSDLAKQTLPLSRPDLLATLGHEIAEARLEKPEEIIQHYLLPAIHELGGSTKADEAGRVFHEFASFCDKQLQNPDDLDDYLRIEQLRHSKEQEVLEFEKMIKAAQGKQKDALKAHRQKTKTWFDLDDREYQRLKSGREAFLRQSLENYLLCLGTCDLYDNDVLRFCTLWLDKSDNEAANNAVGKHIKHVASRKFVPLIHQLSSRLLNEPNKFQSLLFPLLLRVCTDHPFHGMYQMFSASKTRGSQDKTAMARFEAAKKMVDNYRSSKSADIWVHIHNSCIAFMKFAAERLDDRKFKSGSKSRLSKIESGVRLVADANLGKIPPPTMKIPVRADCNYSSVPRLVGYKPEFSIAGGVSAPKVVTAIASDGLHYKQLFKGGNDDLRQDAIMEQVFEQVSNLLQDHRDTRQRNIGIRTYKVLPLHQNTGIIEFVQDTIPLHEYLLPAHQKHFPRDLKPNDCRKQIANVQPQSIDARVKAFKQVADKFHPVLRYFFIEHFTDPDEWFEKRLAYTRSTAAISILGHILGLGDRHGHNILLDENTGEVVHIDLGVAFEQGRVLPVPEVVPFRLTRDLVDGMGITKTEGVFRRCCEFTLEALRLESYSIMTILDVLRYDPLYMWAISPLRMKRIQEAAEEAPAGVPGAADTGKSKGLNEPNEAERALTVVAKKLGKSLSVTATVNELIQQATDERNLAVLYCGWAAYA